MVVCDFIPHVKKHKFSPHICTWKLSNSATASQFQSAFKVKVITAIASAVTAAGVIADTEISIVTVWSKLNDLLLDAVTEVYGLSKTPVETWNLVVELTGGGSYTGEAGTVQNL